MTNKLLLEKELRRFNSINKYVKNLISEQEDTKPEDEAPAPDAGGLGDEPGGLGGDAGGGLGADAGGGLGGATGGGLGADAGGGLGGAAGGGLGGDTGGGLGDLDDTEEIDITDLVNMTKSIKKDVDQSKSEHNKVIDKMDNAFKKLDDLSDKLKEMDKIFDRIERLSGEIKQLKPETPQERLEMRSLDSYPFNQKPNDFFSQKQEEMRMSGKNEYVLTKDDIENYSKEQLRNTFNTDLEDNNDYEQFR